MMIVFMGSGNDLGQVERGIWDTGVLTVFVSKYILVKTNNVQCENALCTYLHTASGVRGGQEDN